MGKNNKLYICNRIILIVIAFSMFISFSYANFDPEWFDTNQPYRTNFNLSGNVNFIDNLTYELNVDDVFMGEYFNFSTHRDSIRIYYYNQTNNVTIQAPHYINSWDDVGETGVIQFKAPVLEGSTDNEYFIYFGSNSYNNVENYCNTFIHCDFFNRTDIGDDYILADNDDATGTQFYINNEELVIEAGGADTWTGSDEFGSVFLNDIEGDVDVQVAVTSQGNVNEWNKAGIMIRNDINSPGVSTGYVFNVVTRDNGYSFQVDTNNNGFLDSSSTTGSRVLPSFLRLTKLGQSFTGYYSTTGFDSWNQTSTSSVSSANDIQDIGLSSTSHAGNTLDNVRYDNLTVRRNTNEVISVSSTSTEFLPNELIGNLISPNPIQINNVVQDDTFELEAEVFCFSYSQSDCNNVTASLQYNDTSSSFADVSSTSTTPMWTINSNPQNCNLSFNNSCNFTYIINMTGTIANLYDFRVLFSSNITSIEDSSTQNLTSRIIDGQFVGFNQSILNLGNITKFLGNSSKSVKVESLYGDNSNINIICTSGDCSQFSVNPSSIASINEGNSEDIDFTCQQDTQDGNFNARFEVSSDESFISDFIDVNCQVEKLYGPLSINKLEPASTISYVPQNESVILRYNLSCLGECGDVEAELIYDTKELWNVNWENKRSINISNSVDTPSNYQVLIELNSSNIPNYRWNNSCEDFRFIYNDSIELSYWTETCDNINQSAFVWVKTNEEILAGGSYQFDIYFNNDAATSNSDADSTFRKDDIYLVTGDWTDGAPVSSQHITNNDDANNLRSTIGDNGWNVQGESYVSLVNQANNIHGADDLYYSRYRFLFIPDSSGTYFFGANSDDGSEISMWNYDGYGSGIRTPINVLTSTQTRLGYWYGAHAAGTCGTSGTQDSASLQANEGYWFDYVMNERTGGQNAEMCINDGSGYSTVSTTNFVDQIYAREYVTPEPSVVSFGDGANSKISTIVGETPLWTSDLQPQNCNIGENSFCIVEWEVNATGPINSSWDIKVFARSNYTQIESNYSNIQTIEISQSITPEIILYNPENNLKFLGNDLTQFLFYVQDDDSNLSCSIYINNLLNQSFNCNTGINNTVDINLSPGVYDWKIRAEDSDLNIVESSTFTFTKILNYNVEVKKSFENINTNLSLVSILVNNKNNNSNIVKVFDFVDDKFNSGSFTLLYDFFDNVIGLFTGRIFSWELDLEGNENFEINYSITNNNESRDLRNNYIIGLE